MTTPPEVITPEYLDMSNTPTQVLDAMTPAYTRGDLEPAHRVTHVDARQVHLTVVQHITVTAPAPSRPAPVAELPAPDPIPVAPMPPGRRSGVDLGGVTAVAAAVLVVAALIVVLVFVDVLVWAMSVALAVFALGAVIALLLSLGGGKCAGIIVHCFGCKH